MKSRSYRAIAVLMAAILIFTTVSFHIPEHVQAKDYEFDLPEVESEPIPSITPTVKPIEMEPPETEKPIEATPMVEEVAPVETPVHLEEWEIILLARLTEAEAGGEPEYGQRLVIDTVLNRMDHPAFPSTLYNVIYQPYHFSPIWNGGINCYTGRVDLIQLVREEIIHRTNRDVIFFQAGGYSIYGVPLFQVGGHYFSSYD